MELSEKEKYAISLAVNNDAWSLDYVSVIELPKINDIIKLSYNKNYEGIFKVKSIECYGSYTTIYLYKFHRSIWETNHEFRISMYWTYQKFLFDKESFNPDWV